LLENKTKVYEPKHPVQTLEKALEVIEFMNKYGGSGMGISEIDSHLELGKSTVHRILDTLMAYDYVEKCSDSSKYILGWKFFEIGNNIPIQRNLTNLNLESLRKLCQKYEETVNFGVRVDSYVTIIFRADPRSTLVANVPIGTREPLYATALGKSILAGLDTEEISRVFANIQFEKFTAKTVSSTNDLIEQMDKIKELGYSIDDEEYYPGLSCIAMPVKNYKNEIVAAVSVSGPSTRLNFTKIMDIKKDLELVTNELSYYLGYNKDSIEE